MGNSKKVVGAISVAQQELTKLYGGRPPAAVAGAGIRITATGSEFKFEIISFIEDFKEDYEYFISMAKSSDNIITIKRYLRAAFLVLNFFLEASVNHLCSIALSDMGKDEHYIKNYIGDPSVNKIGKNFGIKCKFLEQKYLKNNGILSINEKTELRRIRNEMVHFSGNNIKLWDKITLEPIEIYRDKCSLWLEAIRRGMNLKTISSEDLLNFFGGLMGALGVKVHSLPPSLARGEK
jgi:hypothetical protein